MTGVPLFLCASLVSSREMDGKAEGRWLGASFSNREGTIALRTNALRAYEGTSAEVIPPDPRSVVSTIQLTWVCSAYCLTSTTYFSEVGEHCAAVVSVGHQLKAMGNSMAAGGARAQGAACFRRMRCSSCRLLLRRAGPPSIPRWRWLRSILKGCTRWNTMATEFSGSRPVPTL